MKNYALHWFKIFGIILLINVYRAKTFMLEGLLNV